MFIGLATGALSSLAVTIVINVIQERREKLDSLLRRKKNAQEFKILFYNIILHCDMSVEQDGLYNLEEFLYSQHRWFHEFHKKITAKNFIEEEKVSRLQQIKDFIARVDAQFQLYFVNKNIWQDLTFTEDEQDLLRNLLEFYQEIKIDIELGRIDHAILCFSSFLGVLKQVMCELNIEELTNFNLMKFQYANSRWKFLLGEFEKVETFFAFARQFNTIRRNNYITQYGKKNDADEE